VAFISRRKHEREIERLRGKYETEIDSLRQLHNTIIEERTAVVDEYIGDLIEIRSSREPGFREGQERYRISVELDPMVVMYGRYSGDKMSLIAERLCRQVHREIVTSRFVERPHE